MQSAGSDIVARAVNLALSHLNMADRATIYLYMTFPEINEVKATFLVHLRIKKVAKGLLGRKVVTNF